MKTPQNRTKAGRRKPGTFAPGTSGNPGGRPKLPDDLKRALAADSAVLYARAKLLLDELLKRKKFDTATKLLLGLLKKTIPDAKELIVTTPDGVQVQVTKFDAKKLTTEELRVLMALRDKQQA